MRLRKRHMSLTLGQGITDMKTHMTDQGTNWLDIKSGTDMKVMRQRERATKTPKFDKLKQT